MTGSMTPRPRDDDPQDAIDAAFDDIVSRFAEPASHDLRERVGPGAAVPDGDGPADRADDPADEFAEPGYGAEPGHDVTGVSPEVLPSLAQPPAAQHDLPGTTPPGWRVHIPPDDPDDETYRPPRPRPLPAQDATFWVAVVGCVGGPLWFLYLVLTDPYGSRLSMLGAGLATFLGLALTFWRLPRREERDPDDDGARV